MQGRETYGKKPFAHEPLMYIQQPHITIPKARMQHDYMTSKAGEKNIEGNIEENIEENKGEISTIQSPALKKITDRRRAQLARLERDGLDPFKTEEKEVVGEDEEKQEKQTQKMTSIKQQTIRKIRNKLHLKICHYMKSWYIWQRIRFICQSYVVKSKR
ncbi:hypothetical protein RWD45_03950 [Virgibacillus soli]|uniref:Uncharacterized protein n=1 Tax=Paracerasibacillus soli TaxID=480284 RepID=A0ABU5CR37_9BACI|nr:hypothetical protein [Virgibacillus soli]MDY0407918.1 hypothetical protein [Virgibacillus soli]